LKKIPQTDAIFDHVATANAAADAAANVLGARHPFMVEKVL
jgi:hypothetical protein